MAELAPLIARHNTFIDAWQAGDFSACRRMIEDFVGGPKNALSGTHALYRERLAALPDQAPADWDGVFTAKSK